MTGRNQQELTAKLVHEMERAEVDACMFSSTDGVLYSTGFLSGFAQTTPAGSVLSVVTADGEVWLICGEFERHAAEETCDPAVHIVSYPVWIYIEDYATPDMTKDVQPSDEAAIGIACSLIGQHVAAGRTVGIEHAWLPLSMSKVLSEYLAGYTVVDGSGVHIAAREKKTPWEIDQLRANARAAEIAMYQTARAVVPGMNSKTVYQLFERFSREQAPETTSVGRFHTLGSHFSPFAMPVDFEVNRGDLIRLDGGPTVNGYKSDVARTFVVGTQASDDKRAIYQELWNGFQYGVEHVGPGVRMCDVFHGINDAIHLERYGFVRGHYGHSISCGTTGEEPPFIGPEETREFEPGMVFCLETPFYSSTHQTYNIEDTFVVTEDGVEFFTHAIPSLVL